MMVEVLMAFEVNGRAFRPGEVVALCVAQAIEWERLGLVKIVGGPVVRLGPSERKLYERKD